MVPLPFSEIYMRVAHILRNLHACSSHSQKFFIWCHYPSQKSSLQRRFHSKCVRALTFENVCLLQGSLNLFLFLFSEKYFLRKKCFLTFENVCPLQGGGTFWKSQHIVTVCSKYNRALTFENVCLLQGGGAEKYVLRKKYFLTFENVCLLQGGGAARSIGTWFWHAFWKVSALLYLLHTVTICWLFRMCLHLSIGTWFLRTFWKVKRKRLFLFVRLFSEKIWVCENKC
jgi:hypothetical protein